MLEVIPELSKTRWLLPPDAAFVCNLRGLIPDVFGYVSSVRVSKMNIVDIADTSWLYDINVREFNYRKKATELVAVLDKEGNPVLDEEDNEIFEEELLDTYSDEIDGDVQFGAIYEEVKGKIPDTILYEDTTNEGTVIPRGINYSRLIMPTINEVQKLNTRVNTLETEKANVEAQLIALKARLDVAEAFHEIG